ncbi:hypothetical protein ACFSTI_33930 [Rhizorhabdus histidinilytica]|uniref:hypothetical protein n=1 Tax=Sphingomonadales TaxID=204457 RepID=UPI001116C912|nr:MULTISPECIES: hypothetical protein [Sphingomonadaceae]
MKMAVRAMLGALATLALASPSFAATVAPTSYPFTLKGGGNVVQGSNIWACGWTWQAQTTSSTGGTISGGVGDTNPNCGQLSVPATTWSATSATTGVLHGFSIIGGNLNSCSTSQDVPFTIMKSGNNATSFFFNSVNFGPSCNYNANLNTGAALTVTP